MLEVQADLAVELSMSDGRKQYPWLRCGLPIAALLLAVLALRVPICEATVPSHAATPQIQTDVSVLRSAGGLWMASAASVGLPGWPALALVLAPQRPETVRAQIVQTARAVQQRSGQRVGRGLRAMLRSSARGPMATVHSTRTARMPLVQDGAWIEQARISQAQTDQPDRLGRWQLRTPDVRCDACVASASDAEAGEDSIHRNIPDINRFTTLELGDATFKVTSLQPFSLLFKKRF